ncbi:hypothetical protein [Mycetocola miduiensis]|uniref:Uncharacterized protein n=1 Tax=Mycetocola miduiensis TaxID=995034 RepID=A0A1I4ZVU6_9MICO|nr:hypothetical protein [Mycetocola miduiensis]SFN54099.1 hypothetical protein SAMN05216219_1101 [Mycetocola miduiensis]
MTPLPDEQPLSRRQLREQQRTTETSSTPIEPRSRRVSTSSVAGGDIPEVITAPEPELSTEEVAELEEAEAAGRPLTRRQARDLERVRTASLKVIKPQKSTTPDAGTSDSKDVEADLKPAAVEPADVEPAVVVEDAKPAAPSKQASKKPKRSAAPASNRLPSFVPSSAPAPAAEAEVVDAEIVPADIDVDSEPSVTESRTAPAESAFGPAATAQAANRDAAPKVSSSFGQAVLSGEPSKPATVDQPFDQIIARGLEEAGSGVNTSSIILPSMPNGHPLTGPLSANGNVVITGSIDLSSGIGSTGAHPHFDRSDIDAMFDAEDEARPATAGTPVSASKAVSTHTATRDVITPPAPARSNRLLLILAITAGVLAVAVLSVIIVGIAAGAFQSQ